MSDLILSDDPTQALLEIASYLQTVRKDPARRHYEKTGPEGLGKEFAGYWQTPEWVEGLIFLYHEANRVAALQSSRTTTQMEGVPAEGEKVVPDIDTQLLERLVESNAMLKVIYQFGVHTKRLETIGEAIDANNAAIDKAMALPSPEPVGNDSPEAAAS